MICFRRRTFTPRSARRSLRTPIDAAAPSVAESDRARHERPGADADASSRSASVAVHSAAPHAIGLLEIALLVVILLIAGGTAVAARIAMEEMPTFSTGL